MSAAVAPILNDIANKKFHPVYFFCGEEPYFIDQLTQALETHVIPAHEKAFNETILYGKDVNRQMVIEACRRLPMMAERQLILIKEAQFFKELEEIHDYIKKPVQSTILAIAYKGKTPDKRKAFGKDIQKMAVYVECAKLYDNQVGGYAKEMVKQQKLKIDEAALQLLVDNVGNDLSTLANEISKLRLAIGDSKVVTANDVEAYTGISKEYNSFALSNPLGNRDFPQAHKVVNNFIANPKNAPVVLVLASLFNFFQKTYLLATHRGASDRDAASLLGCAPSFVKDYRVAVKNYSIDQLETVFGILAEYDLRAKGVENGDTDQGEMLKELTIRILHV